jgi:TIR domain
MNPKVFISHASEDKKRFVLDFATKLRNSGIDAWLDKWEMLPGDSLVDKIFEEGIKNADVMIIVLSKNSVSKKWVQEELNAGIVKKIEKNAKIIPVIIDDCNIPESLKSTVWQIINNTKNYDDEFEIIKSSIFGLYSKPKLGNIPNYASTAISAIPDFTIEDTIVLKEVCEKAMEVGFGDFSVSKIFENVKKHDITYEIFYESIEILDNRYCFESIKTNQGIEHITLTTYGFELYANNFLQDYGESIDKVAYFLVNSNSHLSNTKIEEGTHLNSYLIRHILDLLESKSYIDQIKVSCGGRSISSVSPELKRMLRER